MNKFDAVETDPDTVVLVRQPCTLGGLDILYEAWLWDGIQAESFIFCNADIAGWSDARVLAQATQSPLVKGECTLKRAETYTFVNFNFQLTE